MEVSDRLAADFDQVKVRMKVEGQPKKDMKDYIGITVRVKPVEPKTIQRSEEKANRVIGKRKL